MLSPGDSEAGIPGESVRHSSCLLGGLRARAQEREVSISSWKVVLNLFLNSHFFFFTTHLYSFHFGSKLRPISEEQSLVLRGLLLA